MKYRTLRQIVDQLEGCGFRCEAGPLEKNVAFERLREFADRLGEIRLDQPEVFAEVKPPRKRSPRGK